MSDRNLCETVHLRAAGTIGNLIRAHDWAATSLGPIGSWPDCLRAAVDLILPARAQIALFWGPQYIAIYNDAYAPTIGNKHPLALGQPARENWTELWSDLEPLLRHVRETGETISARDRPFVIDRHGYLEDVSFDISYSPVCETDGSVGGVLCIVSETTERLLIERAVRDSKEALQAIFAHPTSGMALTDADCRPTIVNARFVQIVGYSAAELAGMRLHELMQPEDAGDFALRFERMTTEGAGFATEKRIVCKDGSLVWVDISAGPIRDADQRIRQTSLILSDITERRRAEEIERRLAAIVESSDAAVLSTDLDMKVTSWNTGAERLYGYLAEEVLGKRVTMLVPGRWPEEEEQAIITRISHGERIAPHETRRVRKDGHEIDVLLTVSPVHDEHGNVIGASKIAHDITARKGAEHLQKILLGEMNHRVKNILATVQAVARQTFAGETDMQAASDAFEARLLSLANAHDLLSRETWDGAELSTVISRALAPYRRENFEIAGPPLALAPKVVLAMSIALHELVTNAVKYGALTEPDGRVTITWDVEPGDPQRCILRWHEQGGPPVLPPSRKGFGSRLIEGVLASELNGSVQTSYKPSGLVCTIDAPVEGGWGDRRRAADP